MKNQIQLINVIQFVRILLHQSSLRRSFLLAGMALSFGWLALAPAARAVSPPPDGGYLTFNTAEGEDALFSLTTGGLNTAIGYNALFTTTTGAFNTATGAESLSRNTIGSENTATGAYT